MTAIEPRSHQHVDWLILCSSRALSDIKLLGPACVGNRTETEMFRICMTVRKYVENPQSPRNEPLPVAQGPGGRWNAGLRLA